MSFQLWNSWRTRVWLCSASLTLLMLSGLRTADAQNEPGGSAPATPAASSSAAPAVPGQAADGSPAPATAPATAPPELELPPQPPPPPPKIPHELRAYQVQIPVVFGISAQMGPAFRRDMLNELRVIADRSIGPMWELEIVEADWITPLNRSGIERITSGQIRQRLLERRMIEVIREQLVEQTAGKFKADRTAPPSESLLSQSRAAIAEADEAKRRILSDALVKAVAGSQPLEAKTLKTISDIVFLYLLPSEATLDKIFPVAVELTGSTFVISSREWDRESEQMTAVRSRITTDRRAVATEIMRLVRDLFHPVMQVDDARPEGVRLRVKAGDYRPADPGFNQAQEGALFAPFFRYLDKNRVVQKIQQLPWSYITVHSIENARLGGVLQTGVSTPLGAFRRKRMELRAIALKPAHDGTTLTLVPRRYPDKPLIGYLVAVYDEPPPPPAKPAATEPAAGTPATPARKDEASPAPATAAAEPQPEPPKPEIFRSNRLGQVHIPVDPDRPLQWIYIRSGSALLAKFPIVAGLESNMTVDCPDDTIRLDVEGQVTLLQTRLIDTIAQRVTLMALAKSRAKKNEWAKVDESLNALKKLPELKDFEQQVTEIQYPAIKKAQARRDRSTESKVKNFGKDVLKVAGVYLDKEKLDDFRSEIEELRRLELGDPEPAVRTAPGQRQQ